MVLPAKRTSPIQVSQQLKADCRVENVLVFQQANTSGFSSIVVPIEFRPRSTRRCRVSASSVIGCLSISKKSTVPSRNILFHHLCRESYTFLATDTSSDLALSNFVGSNSSMLLATATSKLCKDEVDHATAERVIGRERQ